MIHQMAIIINRLAKKTAARTKKVLIPIVQEIVDKHLVTVLLLRIGYTILKILRMHFFLRTKNHSHYIVNPSILQGFIPSGNRLK